MKKIYTVILFATIMTNLQAQDSAPKFRRTGIYNEVGLGNYGHIALMLDHYFFNKKYVHIGAKTGCGSYASWGGIGGTEVFLTANGLLGKKFNFLELQAGGVLMYERGKRDYGSNKDPYYTAIYPYLSAGYALRYKHFLFRFNVCTVPSVNAGIGFAF